MILLLAALFFLIADYKYDTFKNLKLMLETPRYYIMETVNSPFHLCKSLSKYLVLHNNLVEENLNLKRLIKLQGANLQILNSLKEENSRLKNLLKFSNLQKNFLSLANIIEVNPDPFKHQIVINKGSKQGSYVGQPIVNAEGVLGSIIQIERNHSIGILITDLNNAIPVLNFRNGFRAIAIGTGNFDNLILQHIPKTADIKEGDLFVTSGLGGKYPAGYIVGKITNVKKEINYPFAEVNLEVAAKLDSYGEVLLINKQSDHTEKN